MNARRPLLVVAACLALCLTGCADHEAELRVVTFNLCGNVCGHGDHRAADFVVGLAERTGADVLLLQETCRSQAERVRRKLGAHVLYVSTFRGDADGLNECPGDDYGIAIVARRPLSSRQEWPLPNPGLGTTQLDRRVVLCGRVDGTDVCNTHLVRDGNDAEAHRLQVTRFRSIAARFTDRFAVLGGDLNTAMRLPGFHGTDAGLIDHVFGSAFGFRPPRTSRFRCSCSDHPALLASFG